MHFKCLQDLPGASFISFRHTAEANKAELGGVSQVLCALQVISVDIPNHIELVIAETGPGVKGNTVSGGTKAAKLETGAMIQVGPAA